jgi:hypothetical protein
MSKPGDELLSVISVRKHLSYRLYRESFDVIHMRAIESHSGLNEPVAFIRSRSLRLLSQLGHAEVFAYGSPVAVCVAPTVLARIPQPGLPQAVLCGSRGLDAALVLRRECLSSGQEANTIVSGQVYGGGYAPSSIFVQAINEDSLKRIAEQLGIKFEAYPPAWRLINYSAGIDDYETELVWYHEPDPVWPRKDFSTKRLTFSFELEEMSNRLSMFEEPITHRRLFRLHRSIGSAATDMDWGRWVYLRDNNNVLLFDESRQAVYVPATVPLPGLLARGISLFSGVSPSREPHPEKEGYYVDVYTGIPLEAAELLALKLGQNLMLIDGER